MIKTKISRFHAYGVTLLTFLATLPPPFSLSLLIPPNPGCYNMEVTAECIMSGETCEIAVTPEDTVLCLKEKVVAAFRCGAALTSAHLSAAFIELSMDANNTRTLLQDNTAPLSATHVTSGAHIWTNLSPVLSWKSPASFQLKRGQVYSLSPCGRWCAVAESGGITIFDLVTKRVVRTHRASGKTKSLAVGMKYLIIVRGKTAAILGRESGEVLGVVPCTVEVGGLSLSPCERYLIVASLEDLRVYDISTPDEPRLKRRITTASHRSYLSHDMKYLAGHGPDGYHIFSFSGEQRFCIPGAREVAAFSPCGRLFATTHRDALEPTVQIWGVPSGALLHIIPLKGGGGAVRGMQFSQCGEHLYVGHANRNVFKHSLQGGDDASTVRCRLRLPLIGFAVAGEEDEATLLSVSPTGVELRSWAEVVEVGGEEEEEEDEEECGPLPAVAVKRRNVVRGGGAGDASGCRCS